MKKKILPILFVFCNIILSQTTIDSVAEKLDLLNNASFNNWKYSTDLSLPLDVISKIDYDDSNWETLRLNDRIYPDTCWFRKVIELPNFVCGQPIEGKIYFNLTVDDYGYLTINGEQKGRFNWDGNYILSENAKPKEKYIMVIKACNTAGPMRLMRAELGLESRSKLQQEIEDFILSIKTGQKLLSFDTYQSNSNVTIDPGIDKSKDDKETKNTLMELLNKEVAKLKIDLLENGKVEEFKNSLNEVRKNLKPVAEFSKKFTLHFTANAHIDAAWLWRKKETIDVCYHTFSSVMNMYKARTDNTKTNFAYSQSQAALYKWMQDLYPDLFNQIQDKVNSNTWEIVGGMWVEPDCNLPDGVSWYRQLLYGQKYFEKNLGKRATIGWNPDSFGYNWNLPSFLVKAGIDVFITQKIGWNDTNVFPYRVFWWQSPDGSRVLAYFPFDYVNDVSNPTGLVDWIRQFEANTGFKSLMILFGVGNHGGGPSIEMMKRIDRLANVDIFPKVEFGSAGEYLDWLKKEDLSDIPTWNDELYLEYHRGTLTSQANTKKHNRQNETLLSNAEKFASINALNGFEYEKQKISNAWENVLFNQFHDILPGSSIRDVYLDSEQDYQEATDIGKYVLNNALGGIIKNINSKKLESEKVITVFNPLNWIRTDLVKVELPEGDNNNYSVYDSDDNIVTSQRIEKDELKNELLFVAEEVPSVGYKTYKLKSDNQQKPLQESLPATVNTSEKMPPRVLDYAVENEFYKVKIDTDSGYVKSIFSKKLQKELLDGNGNKLQLLEDMPRHYDAWNIGLTGVEFPSTFRKVEIAENGPLRTVIRVYRDYLKPGTKKAFPTEDFPSSFFTQDIIIYNGIDRVDFKTNVEWFEAKTMLKVLFPVTSCDSIATYEIPYGTIKRSTTLAAQKDKGKWEVASIRFADLSNKEYGVSLLNKFKYGYDIKGNKMRLSLLRSPKSPDATADIGFHEIEYAIYSHEAGVNEGDVVRKGYEFNNELIGVIGDAMEGSLPIEKSFIKLEPENIILTTVKKAEETENAFVYQFYETMGKETPAELTLPGKPKRIEWTNFLEDEGQPVKFDGNKVELNVKANSVVTLKVMY